jgi:glycosyltransferase involved in cell wall biosynthesis
MSRLRGILTDPLLSVVMPVYNEAATIEEIIRRVLAVPVRTQLIVVDDCSTDGTRDMLAGLQRELGFTLLCSRRTGARARRCAPASIRFAETWSSFRMRISNIRPRSCPS